MTVTIVSISRAGVAGKLADLRSVYEQMNGLPAGSGEEFVPLLTGHCQRPDFRLYAALDQEHNKLVGFAYGYTCWPGQPWRDGMAQAVGVEAAAEWLTGQFDFAQFGVIPDCRRRGIGTRLHAALLCGLPHHRAVLTVLEKNTLALGFYHTQGWRVLYEGFFSATGLGPYRIMGKTLRRRSDRTPGSTIVKSSKIEDEG